MSRLAGRTRSGAGFTLIEVLAVLFLTALVVGVALNFFIDLSNQSQHASDATRELRRATGLIDRVARDLERTVLVRKPKDEDPLANPWIFVAEPRFGQDGSDRVKFVSRSETALGEEGAASDLSTVAYSLERNGDGPGFVLHRWSSPHLPERLDRDFPPPTDPASLVLADGVSHFAMRFLGDTGEWTDRWDSSQLVESSELPVAVEIEVALLPAGDAQDGALNAEPVSYSRRVLLPVRPLDMEALLDPTRVAGNNQDSQGCKLKLADCIDFSTPNADTFQALKNLNPTEQAALRNLVTNAPNICWDQYRALYGNLPNVRPECR